MLIKKNHFSILLLVGTISAFCGCSKSTDEDKIGSAQFCLDDVPISGLTSSQRASKINTCLAKLESVNTNSANIIRCSAGFMIEGFADPAKLIQIVDEMSTSTNSNPTTAIMSLLVFKTSGASDTRTSEEDESFATTTYNYCMATESVGYRLIASFANIATSLAYIADTYNFFTTNPDGTTNYDIQGLLQNPGAATTLLTQSDQVIGVTAIAAAQASCAPGTQNSDQAICQQLNTVIASNGTSDPSQIGADLRAIWQQSH